MKVAPARARARLAPVAAAILAALPGLALAHEGEEAEHLIPHQFGAITIDGDMTWVLQGTDSDAGNDSADLTYTLDLNLEGQLTPASKLVVALETGDGNGVDSHLGALSIANYDAFITATSAGFTAPSVSQAYYEGDYRDGAFQVLFGKLDVHSLYDTNAYANDETDQFISGIFTRSAGTSYQELDNYYAPALAVTWASEQAELMVLAANGNGSGFDEVDHRPYFAAQLTLKPVLMGHEGNYRVYAIRDERRYTDLSGNDTENNAWGISFDQELARGVGAFLRYSTQDDQIVQNLVKSSWSLGTLLEGSLWGREDDTVGLAYGVLNINDKPQVLANAKADGTIDSSLSTTDDETHLELFYKFTIAPEHVTVTPSIQLIGNVGAQPGVDARVYGVRAQLNL
ncbi:MAG: hypothetical protein D6809_00470 [Gammaproteobacteria bacterium]|nr:MAG: hypothetical protein D6809_00470 [Gammaproteobacteria bacterium]